MLLLNNMVVLSSCESYTSTQKRPGIKTGPLLFVGITATPSRQSRLRSSGCSCNTPLVEPRGVEPLSEDQTTRASPSAVCVLTFPPRGSRRQDPRISSFIKSHRPQSLRRLVPCLYDADGLRRRRLRVDDRD